MKGKYLDVETLIRPLGDSLDVAAGFQTGSRLIPANSVDFIPWEELEDIRGYEWESGRNLRDARSHFEGFIRSGRMGLINQAGSEAKVVLDIFNLDRCEKAVRVVKDYGIKAKVFCRSDHLPRGEFIVESDKWDWRVMPVERYDRVIPLQVLRKVELLAQQGVVFHDYRIAVPETAKYQPLLTAAREEFGHVFEALKRSAKQAGTFISLVADAVLVDPVILGRLGNWFVEIARWK